MEENFESFDSHLLWINSCTEWTFGMVTRIGEENSEFKPDVLHLKTDFVLQPTRSFYRWGLEYGEK